MNSTVAELGMLLLLLLLLLGLTLGLQLFLTFAVPMCSRRLCCIENGLRRTAV